jgi:hypothetical protein
MFTITVERIGPEQLKKLGVFDWDIWEKEPSTFDWHYDEPERCYFLAGKVRVEPADGPAVDIRAGDFVTFPAGMSCTWKIAEAVKKHYKFG